MSHPQNKIEKEIYFLKVYALLMTLICMVCFTFIFKSISRDHFTEINVERINVVESNGQLRMVISNKDRQHPGVIDGVIYHERKGLRAPGLMFFNEKGDELGGLVFDGNHGKGQGGSFTFDKFRGDQTIQLIHEEDEKENYFAGLKMNDQNMPLNDLIVRQKEIEKLPTKQAQEAAYQEMRDQGLLMTERLRIGKDYDKSSVIRMRDAQGKVRIELKVEASGNSLLKFLNESGQVVYSLPPNSLKTR